LHFTDKDVVRHNLVQRIIRAYEEYEVDHPHRNNGQYDAKHGARHEDRHTESGSSADKQ
jgi:hypothetical protein